MDDANRPTGQTSISFIRGPLAGSTFQVTKTVTTIGRAATNDIVVKDDPQVSRQHVRLLYNNGTWSIDKHPQANVVTINEQSVQQGMVPNNASVGLGQDTVFVFQTQPAPGVQPRPAVQQPSMPLPQQPPRPVVYPQQSFTPQQPVTPPVQQPYGQQPSQPYAQQSFAPPAPPQPYGQQVQQPYGQPAPYPAQNLAAFAPPGTPSNQIVHQSPSNSLLVHSSTGALSMDGTVIGPSPVANTNFASLEVTSNVSSDKQVYRLDQGSVITVGRGSQKDNIVNDINIPHPTISARHFQIVREGNDLVLIHPPPGQQRTTNGLLYQGRKIRGDEQFRHALKRGDVFRIGNEQGTLITLTYNDGSGQQQDAQVPAVEDIRLTAPELTIGRRQGNTVVLPHPQVSSQHARLVREGGSYRILDMGSTNHVYVNNQIVTSHLLRLGDEIRIGPYKLIYESNKLTRYDESNFIRIDAQGLRKTGNNNVTLLSNISVCIPPRKFVALVGGSGAGKSTLMDALNGLRPAHQGKVLYNGQDYYRNMGAFSSQLGYVPQDDIVHRDLTVERALFYAAKMRLPSDFTNVQIEQRIKEVLEDVEMTARRKLLIKKLSGGQRKRVSIALELLANPGVFFLDEPTSGLDPGLDRKMMYLLRKLADAGHTIVLVTHATNNINSCDYVCFLCQGGRLAYFGPPDGAKAFFGKNDFAEIYTSLEPTEENKNIPEEAEMRFRASPEYRTYITDPMQAGVNGNATTTAPAATKLKRTRRSNPIKQFFLLCMRQLELLRNNKGNLMFLLLQAPLIAILLMILVKSEITTNGPPIVTMTKTGNTATFKINTDSNGKISTSTDSSIFQPFQVVQCQSQILQSVVQTNPQVPLDSPQSAGGQPLGFTGPDKNNPTVLVSCDDVKKFLQNNKQGIDYVNQKKEGTSTGTDRLNKALQDFVVSGDGLNTQRAAFIIAFMCVMLMTINGVREIVKEQSIYRRERTVSLGIAPYLASKLVVLGIFAIYQSVMILLIVQLLEPLHQSVWLTGVLGAILEVFITLLLTSFAGLLIGLVASAFSPNEDTVNSLMPLLLVPQIIFAGTEIPLKSYALQGVATLFPTRWAMVSLGTILGLHGDKLGGDRLLGGSDVDFAKASSTIDLSKFNYLTYHGNLFSVFTDSAARSQLFLGWIVLGVIIVVLTIATGIGLKLKDKRT